jgi:hypothetical protein
MNMEDYVVASGNIMIHNEGCKDNYKDCWRASKKNCCDTAEGRRGCCASCKFAKELRKCGG